MAERKVTTLEEWRSKSQPLVDISGFGPGETITVRLKPVSMVKLVQTGKIPNALLQEATKLFKDNKKPDGSGANKIDEAAILNNLGETDGVMQIIDTVVESAMVEPTYDEVREYITDAQKMEIFSWTQGGVESLKSFREEQRDTGLPGTEQSV